MSDCNATEIIVPVRIEGIIQDFDAMREPFDVMAVSQALGAARAGLKDAPEPEQLAAWCEVLAFALIPNRTGPSPWGTYFSPMGSGTDHDGKTVYFPDIAQATPSFIDHWTARARDLNHPVLVARYSDLVWEFAPLVTKARRDPEMVRLAIEAYLACCDLAVYPELHDRLESAIRAFDLACMIRDDDEAAAARDKLLCLQSEAIDIKQGFWWLAFDRLIEDKNAGLTDVQEKQLIGGLEELVVVSSDTSKADRFDPYCAENAANRLIGYYSRKQRRDEVRRLQEIIAKAFEHLASIGSPMLAASALQTAVNAYRDARMTDDSQRVRKQMEEKIRASRDEMVAVSIEFTISHQDIGKFCDSIVVDDLGATFARLAVAFLPVRARVEENLRQSTEAAPLNASMTQNVLADDHVAAVVGSVEDDTLGRVLRQAIAEYDLAEIWMHHALGRLFETHDVHPDHFVSWANRCGIFEDTTFLREGIAAWLSGDLYKAIHLLVPQVERGLRGVAGRLGKPATKAHPSIPGASVALSMGDILYNSAIQQQLGPNLTLYFLAAYADPRGYNLRNQIAHGLMRPGAISEHTLNLLVHSFLVFGLWEELAARDGGSTSSAN
jgi:lysyl-tRNA synthetase class 1